MVVQLSPVSLLPFSMGSEQHLIDDGSEARAVDRRRMIGILSAGLMVAFLSVWFVGSALGLRPSELMSYKWDDGFCVVGRESLFGHCFGDFAIFRDSFMGDQWNPSGPGMLYPASALLVMLGIFGVGHLLGLGQAPVMLFLALAALCMLVPAVAATRRGVGSWRIVPLISLLTAPFLMVMDRGNSVALTVPLIWLVGLAYVRRRHDLLAFALVAVILLKPQFAIFGVLLLMRREYIRAIVVAVTSAILTVVSFLAFPDHFPGNVVSWLQNLGAYGISQPIGSTYPYNLSAAQSIVSLMDLTGIGALVGAEPRAQVVNWLSGHGAALGVALLFIGVIILFSLGEHVPPLVAVLIPTLMVMTLSSATVFAYYTVLLLPVAALLVLRGADPRGGQWEGFGDAVPMSGRVRWLTVLTVSLPLVPMVVPASILGETAMAVTGLGPTVSLYQLLIGPLLLTSYLAFLVWLAPGCLRALRPVPAVETSAGSDDERRDSKPDAVLVDQGEATSRT